MSLKDDEVGYCEKCNKEVPVLVTGILETHYLDGNFRIRDSYSFRGNGLCDGSGCKPAPGVVENAAFGFTTEET